MQDRVELPQLTFKAIVLGILLAIVLAGSNAYLGLFAGITVSASIPAAVISMGILRFFKNSNILENNIVQTSASAGESVAAGAIFTLPALILLDYWNTFDYLWVCVIVGLGGLLGVLYTVPLRRSLIVEEQLPFPEGAATAEVLRAGDTPGRGLFTLAIAAVAGALIKFGESGLRLWPDTAETATTTSGGSVFFFGSNLSPALVSVGFIVGLNIAALVFAGGVIAWGIAIPVYSAFFMEPSTLSSVDLAYTVWSTKIRYLGVGAMLVGGLWTLVSVRRSLLVGITGGLNLGAAKTAATAAVASTERDLPMPWVLSCTVLFVVPLFVLYELIINNVGVGLTMTVIMIVAGFLFATVAAYMAGLVGSSNNPVSGVTIATILFASLVLLWLSGASPAAAASAILTGAVICCGSAIAGDNMQDLKAGYILGATPWKQQLMQCIGVVSAALVMAPVLNLLLTAYGLGPATATTPNSLPAPQATLMADVARGVFGGALPWDLISTGALIGCLFIAADEWLKARSSSIKLPVLAVGIGLYLPLELSSAIFIGGFIAWLVTRSVATPSARGRGILIAAGLITGEALIGIAIAIPIAMTGNPDVLAATAAWRSGPLLGILLLAGVAFALWYFARESSNR